MRLTPYELSLCAEGERKRRERLEDLFDGQSALLLSALTHREVKPEQLRDRPKPLGQSPREKFKMLWMAQGKSEAEAEAIAAALSGPTTPSERLNAALETGRLI